MSETVILKDDLFMRHIPNFNHVECPDRLEVIYEALSGLEGDFLMPQCVPATIAMLESVHTPEHVAAVAETAGCSFTSLDTDTQASPRSYDAACLAAGAVVQGVDMVVAGEADNGFALVRPPGHHAEAYRAMGFCLFNNVAVAAQHAVDILGLERVMIVDWDLHHGNGTQHIFYDRPDVFYISTHAFPYYPGTGSMLETGDGPGEGYTLNIPLPGSQDDRSYSQVFKQVVAPVARQYKPQLIIVSAGFDIYGGDPLGTMAVSASGFGSLARILNNIASEVCEGRILFALEGGYNLNGLRDGVMAVLAELSGNEIIGPPKSPVLAGTGREQPIIDQVVDIAKNYWKL